MLKNAEISQRSWEASLPSQPTYLIQLMFLNAKNHSSNNKNSGLSPYKGSANYSPATLLDASQWQKTERASTNNYSHKSLSQGLSNKSSEESKADAWKNYQKLTENQPGTAKYQADLQAAFPSEPSATPSQASKLSGT